MASVEKFKMNEAPRLLSHCSRTQRSPGEHIHKDRTYLNFNEADGRHPGQTDYEFVKSRTHDENVRMLKRDDVKAVCSWVVTLPRSLCHEAVDEQGNEYYTPNDMKECRNFFDAAYDFLSERHGEQNVISSYVHMDENVPHMHFTFVPIVQDKDGHEKVCAKEALHDCYGAKFQISLQDYISERMGKELDMVKKDTVDYERNVKELKRKTLNERCVYLNKEIARCEEELERKVRILKSFEASQKAAEEIDDIKTTTSNGFTLMREPDWLRVKPLIRSIKAMQAERRELREMLDKFANTNTAQENARLSEQASALMQDNERLERELHDVQRFMDTTEIDGVPLSELYEQHQEERRQNHARMMHEMYHERER